MPFHLNRARCSRFRSAFRVCALLAAVVALFAFNKPASGQVPGGTYPIGSNTRLPDANDYMMWNQQLAKRGKFEADNLKRKLQMDDDVARLLQLATELKEEVDKAGKDSLSPDVVNKADTIEKLAKGVKEKMQLTVGAS